MIQGFATPAGTRNFAARFQNLSAHRWFQPAGEILVSNLGMGTYLGQADDAADLNYERAALAALRGGINMLDTARNYRGGRSEIALGRAIAEYGRREEVIVATKAGFAGRGHSIEPAFLEEQLGLSLRALDLKAVDVFYLHNPETQLQSIPQAALMRLLEKAFAKCEDFVRRGIVKSYGTATWSAYREPGQLDVAEVIRAAGPGFQWIQLPLNAVMNEGLAAAEQAAKLGVNVATSASLMQGKLAGHLPVALQFARYATGVKCALVGMGREEHVALNLEAATAEID
jgi:aryl-alcohol dehydrogenase-like predicted oxidoreductase